MKTSIYNYILKLRYSDYILFNTLYDTILVMKPELYTIFNENLESLKNLHREFYNVLIEQHFLVDETVDEYEVAIEQITEIEKSLESCYITINPTLDCNCKCWYCYENHHEGSKMDTETIEAAKKLIGKYFSDIETKHILISFFGGEPLMYYHEIVKDILQFSQKCANATGKQLDVSITTNGYLLTNDIIKDLKKYSLVMQIALDGNEQLHNETKFLKDKTKTYQTIKSNIKKALDNNISIIIRCNYTNKNILSFKDVANDFKDYSKNKYLSIAMHKIWQIETNDNLNKDSEEIYNLFKDYGFSVSHMPVYKDLCYADKDKSFVINYDGNIYKCTARDFNKSNSIGILKNDGTILFNENANMRKRIRFNNADCRKCVVFPLCMQTCSQNIMETKNKNKCISINSARNIETLIRKRIELLTSLKLTL